MPFFRTAGKIVYFAHVPKCAGTSVENYLIERFGTLALLDRRFMLKESAARWSRTSPQHIDWQSLQTILPATMIDASFTVVRHPVARAESAFHFQIGVERSIPPETRFSDWLREQISMMRADPFVLDGHMRPQSDFVPEGAAIFHVEHGLDALVHWLDVLTGNADGPRGIGHTNKRKSSPGKVSGPQALEKSSPEDIALLEEAYANDFARFGYSAEDHTPRALAPALPEGFTAARDRDLARRNGLLMKLRRRAIRWLSRP